MTDVSNSYEGRPSDMGDAQVPNAYSLMAKSDQQIVDAIGTTSHAVTKEEPVGENQEILIKSTGERTLIQRMFSRMEAGSVRGSIFAMSSLALGTGCLALPIRNTQMSLLGGMIMLLLGATVAYWSLTIMIEASGKYHMYDYSRLVKQSLGTGLGMVLDIIILIYIFGVLVSYQVIIYSLLGRVYWELFIDNGNGKYEDYERDHWGTYIYKFPIMYVTCAILIPLCLLKDISKMRIASLFSICSLIYVIIVIVIESPFYYNNYIHTIYQEDKPETHANWYNVFAAFGSKLYFFAGTATVFFAFTCHVGAFPVYKTLKDNVSRRINKVFQRSILLDVVIYILVGICGFLTAPVDAPPLIIYRKKYFENDIFMIFAKVGITFNLILSTPANYNAFRLSLLELLFKTNEVTNNKNFLMTIPTLAITCLVGVLYDKIINYISILGGFCSVIIAFLMPGLLYVKNNDMPIYHPKNILTIILITVLCIIGWTAGILTIMGVYN